MLILLATFSAIGMSCSSDDSTNTKDKDTTGPEETEQITLKASSQTVTVGDAVSFTAMVEGKAIKGFKLYISNKEVANPYTFEKAGNFNVVAMKEGFKASATISIVVRDKQQTKTPPVLTLVTDPNKIFANEVIELTVTDKDDNPLDGAILVFDGSETDVTSESGIYKIAIRYAGTYSLKARYNDLDSNEVVLKVVDNNPAVGSGQFVFKGNTYQASGASTVLKGFFKDDDETILTGWQEELYADDGKVAIVIYYTAAQATEDGTYEPVLPTVDNTKLAFGGVIDADNNLLGKSEDQGVLKVSYNITDMQEYLVEGDFDTTNGLIEGSEFKVTFKGDHRFIVSNSTSSASKSSMGQIKPLKELTRDIRVSNILM